MFLVSKQKASGESRVKAAPLLLFFTIQLLCMNGFSYVLPADTTKNKYDLNDPRNPNCPCHKHQQQAENEYRQLQSHGNFSNTNKLINVNNLSDQIGGNEGNEMGFTTEKIHLNIGKISVRSFKKKRAEGIETGESKRPFSQGVRKEIFSFSYVKMRFPASKTHKVKHRKTKGHFGDKLSRCFHF